MTTNDNTGQGSATGVSMVQLASYIVWAVFLIFEVITEEYFVGSVGLVIAAGIIGLPRLAPGAVEAIAPVTSFVKVSGYLLAFTGVIELLVDIRAEVYDGFAAILGAVLAYVAYVLAFMGARSIDA